MSIELFAKNLRFLRKQKQLSQEGLAKKIFVSRSLIALIETKRQRPTVDFIEKACLLFETNVLIFLHTDLSAA